MAIKADIEALKDSVRARINDNEEQDITAADVRESVIDTIDTLHEETERDFQKKETGKGLSKNDYTDEDKAKVDGSIHQIIHNGEAVPVVGGTARISTITTPEVDSKISYAINNEARERQAIDTRFRQEIGDINALETAARQLVPAINEAFRKTGGDSYTKAEADERFATKEELDATHVLIPYIDEYSTDAELSAALDILNGAEEGANILCEVEQFSGRYAVAVSPPPLIYGVTVFYYIMEEEYIKKSIFQAPLGSGRNYRCDVTATPIGGGVSDAYTKAETDELLSGKQPTITDLESIRSGASAGATAVQPSALNSYAKKADVDKIVITLPYIDEESTQATLKQAYDKVVAHPNAVFRFDNGILLWADVDDLTQVNLQYHEGNEVVQMVIADNVGTYVLARYVVALANSADVVDLTSNQDINGNKRFLGNLRVDFDHLVDDDTEDSLKEKLTTLRTKVGEKAKVTPTLTSGTQIATITTENAEGQAVETPLYAPQGGGGEPSQYIKDATKSADGNTLTLTKKDGSQLSFSPSGGGTPFNADEYDLSAIVGEAVFLFAHDSNGGFFAQTRTGIYKVNEDKSVAYKIANATSQVAVAPANQISPIIRVGNRIYFSTRNNVNPYAMYDEETQQVTIINKQASTSSYYANVFTDGTSIFFVCTFNTTAIEKYDFDGSPLGYVTRTGYTHGLRVVFDGHDFYDEKARISTDLEVTEDAFSESVFLGDYDDNVYITLHTPYGFYLTNRNQSPKIDKGNTVYGSQNYFLAVTKRGAAFAMINGATNANYPNVIKMCICPYGSLNGTSTSFAHFTELPMQINMVNAKGADVYWLTKEGKLVIKRGLLNFMY